ncbi:hypothetical protein V474_16730 [Novosphingobium barchaimii LL02]|uniref:Uncharacterized protein n=1 Tax=Novosphingobium barchaimii LL02 TaxID=1114963 RepID=A0A0J8AQK7_9SPHN|nr:hypothetical protein V474_16730 [Novosphingobium barchaimii LL02]
MTEPVQDVLRKVKFAPVGQGGAVNHQYRQAQLARRDQFGAGAAAACVLAHDEIDGVRPQQIAISPGRERTAVHHQAVVGQRGGMLRRVDKAEQVVVLGLRGESIDVHPAQRQHDAAARPGKRLDGIVKPGHARPAIARLGLPAGPGERGKGRAGQPCGGYGIGAHHRRERMRGVDEVGYAVLAQVRRQPGYSAEAADARGNGLRSRAFGAARVAEDCGYPAFRQQQGKPACLGCTAQQQDVGFD